MDSDAFFNLLTTVELQARLGYGEARNQGIIGLTAVMFVPINRAKRGGWWGSTVRECILYPSQFSCFNPAYRANLITPNESIWLDCLQVAHDVMASKVDDPTGGATHYFADYIDPPSWAAGMTHTATIGRHLFYK